MKECKYCGKIYKDELDACPSCGGSVVVTEAEKRAAELHQKREEQRRQDAFEGSKDNGGLKKVGIFVAIAVVLVIILIIAIPRLGGSSQDSVPTGKQAEDIAQAQGNKESEAAYEQALTYMAAEDYTGAIAELDRIDSSYKDYDKVIQARNNALKAYKTQAFATVDQYIANGDFSNALSVLDTMERIIGVNTDISVKRVEVNKADVNAVIAECEARQDYAGAIEYINKKLDIINNDANILIKLSELENAYRTFVELDVNNTLSTDGYESAVTKVGIALSVLPNDDFLLALQEECLSYQPLLLDNLEFINAGGLKILALANVGAVDKVIDNFGNEYDSGLVLAYGNDLGVRYEGWREYYLNGSYSTLSGKFVLANEYKSSDKEYVLEIYGDDILLDRATVTAGSEPQTISVNLTGVQILKILMKAPGTYYTGFPKYAYFVEATIMK